MRFLVSFAFAVFVGLMTAGGAQPASADQITCGANDPNCAGITFVVGDKLFTITGCDISSSGDATPGPCSALTFTTEIVTSDGETLYGFYINGWGTANGCGTDPNCESTSDLQLNYTVQVLDPDFEITDAELNITGSTTGNAAAFVDESLTGADETALGTLHADFTCDTCFSDTLDFAGQDEIFVSKDAQVSAEGLFSSNIGSISKIEQLYSQSEVTEVPEPVSLALFGAGLFGIGWLRRRKANRVI